MKALCTCNSVHVTYHYCFTPGSRIQCNNGILFEKEPEDIFLSGTLLIHEMCIQRILLCMDLAQQSRFSSVEYHKEGGMQGEKCNNR